jgi:hypothetical protein
MLSDRAPALLTMMFGDTVVQISNRLDATRRADGVLGGNVTGNDAIVHVGIWATVALLAGVALWNWWGLLVSSAAIAVGSMAIELAQGRYSDTRAVEQSDAIANLIGVAAATAVCALSYLTWSAVAGAVGVGRRRRVDQAGQPA